MPLDWLQGGNMAANPLPSSSSSKAAAAANPLPRIHNSECHTAGSERKRVLRAEFLQFLVPILRDRRMWGHSVNYPSLLQR
ncbi:hypothetical protein ABID59_004273 [Bradyrhizobium sp. S3.3.6]